MIVDPQTGLTFRYTRMREFLKEVSALEGVIASVLAGGRATPEGLATMARKVSESEAAGPDAEKVLTELEIAAALHVILSRRETRKVIARWVERTYGVNRHVAMAGLGGPSHAGPESIWGEIKNVIADQKGGFGLAPRATLVSAEGDR